MKILEGESERDTSGFTRPRDHYRLDLAGIFHAKRIFNLRIVSFLFNQKINFLLLLLE